MPGYEGAAVLVLGLSTRAAAASAARAGFAVTAIDAFADRDQQSGVRALAVHRFTARAAGLIARTIAADAVVYLSPFENHPDVVRALMRGRALWGNPPEVLRRVRDPQALVGALARFGFDTPRGTESLLKPIRSGGGQRIRPWRTGDPIPRGMYVQPHIDGEAWSIVFVAAATGIVTLGVSQQIVGDPAFGASGFRYCGSILDRGSEALSLRATELAAAVSEEFGLVGVNGIDFIRRGNEPVAIEVNPRWSASMELIERGGGTSVFAAHAAACASGTLPAAAVPVGRVLPCGPAGGGDVGRVLPCGPAGGGDVGRVLPCGPAGGGDVGRVLPCGPAGACVHGKAVVFARQATTVGDTSAWLDDADVRDVPHAGERIAAGRPVCTVFAAGDDAEACYAGLVARADRMYRQLDEWRRSVA